MTDGTSENSKPTMDSSEPSMEDILASIRQLIAADDDMSGSGAAEAIPASGEAPLELDIPLVLDSPIEESAEEALGIPDIEIEAADLTPDNPSSGGIDIAVETVSDNSAVSDADDDMILNDLMGDIISEDGPENVPEISAENAFVETPLDPVAADLAEAMAVEDLTSETSDDPLEALLDGITDGTVGPNDDMQAISSETDSDAFTKMDDVDLGQDFDELMESFMADDAPDADDVVAAEALSPSVEVADSAPENENIVPAADELNLDGLIDNIMGPDSAAALDMTESPDASADDAAMFDSQMSELAEPKIEADDIDAPMEASDEFDLDSLLGDIVEEDTAVTQPSETETNLETNEPPVSDSVANNLDNEEINLDSILSDFDEELTEGVDITEDEQDVTAADGAASENMTHDDAASVDPDIALVKSLMAELTDTPEPDTSSEDTPENLVVEDASSDEVADSEDDVLFDLLSETLASEETIQADIQSDIAEQVESIMGEEAPDSSLAELAETITSDAELSSPETSAVPSAHMAGAAVAGGSLLAAVMAQTNETKPSALEALMSDEGAELDLNDDMTSEISSKTDLNPSDMDDLVAEIINQDEGEIAAKDDSPDADIDDVLNSMLAAEAHDSREEQIVDAEQNNAVETDNDLSLIEELLAPEVPNMVEASDITEINVPLDANAETLNIMTETFSEPSKVEIDDMAVKPARETILDDVTETAAASAFAERMA